MRVRRGASPALQKYLGHGPPKETAFVPDPCRQHRTVAHAVVRMYVWSQLGSQAARDLGISRQARTSWAQAEEGEICTGHAVPPFGSSGAGRIGKFRFVLGMLIGGPELHLLRSRDVGEVLCSTFLMSLRAASWCESRDSEGGPWVPGPGPGPGPAHIVQTVRWDSTCTWSYVLYSRSGFRRGGGRSTPIRTWSTDRSPPRHWEAFLWRLVHPSSFGESRSIISGAPHPGTLMRASWRGAVRRNLSRPCPSFQWTKAWHACVLYSGSR